MNLYELKDVSYFYPESTKAALEHVSLSIQEGEFILVLGPSASGKSTFGKLISGLIPNFYGGRLFGELQFQGEPLDACPELRKQIGVLFQNPERQILAAKVENELVFGMENLGMSASVMKKRLAEVTSFLNLHALSGRETKTLSGGEKQKLVLGSLLAMGARILVLDEPTSQLDPVASDEIFDLLRKLHQDLGYTIILIEHRTDVCFPLADRILFFEQGKLAQDLPASDFLRLAGANRSPYLPKVTQVFLESGVALKSNRFEHCSVVESNGLKGGVEQLPVTVAQGRKELKELYQMPGHPSPVPSPLRGEGGVRGEVITFQKINFWYKHAHPLFENFDWAIPQNRMVAVVGENGAGKSSLLKLAAGALKPQSGEVTVNGKSVHQLAPEERVRAIGYLSQQPDDYLFHDTVRDEIAFTLNNAGLSVDHDIQRAMEFVDIQCYERKNPRDLSFGEKERVALASILAAEPKLLLLDEPTRGLDPENKCFLGSLFSKWVREQNRTIVMASQDIEFVAEYADDVIWIGHGKILQAGSARDVLEDNLFFSTQVNRLFRGFAKKVLTVSDARKKIASFTTHHLLHPVPREASSAKMARNGLVSPKKIFPEATVVKPWYGVHEQ